MSHKGQPVVYGLADASQVVSRFSIDPATCSDRELVDLALDQPAQFSHLFDRYWNQVFKLCYYRTGNWHLAEDAASQTFLNALRFLQTFEDQGRDEAFKCWLFRIAVNTSISLLRKNSANRSATLDQAAEYFDGEPTPEESALASEAHEEVGRLLGLLKPEQRQLIELRLAGLNDLEISRVVGRSHGAVRKAQSRAVADMRAIVERERAGRAGSLT